MNNLDEITVTIIAKDKEAFIRTNYDGKERLVARMDVVLSEMVFYDVNEVDVLTLPKEELGETRRITSCLDKEWGMAGFGERVGKTLLEALDAYAKAQALALYEGGFRIEGFVYKAIPKQLN